MDLIKELFIYIYSQRKWWLAPIILLLLISKHSKKCTFYTLRFGCSFAAVNTIKPQLL